MLSVRPELPAPNNCLVMEEPNQGNWAITSSQEPTGHPEEDLGKMQREKVVRETLFSCTLA